MKGKKGAFNLSEQKLLALRHTAEHILQAAMQKLFPKIKKAMGPPTAEGFYFDFESPEKISESDFAKIEKEMKKLIAADLMMVKEEISAEKARKIFATNPYKLEWIGEIEGRKEPITVYKMIDQKGKIYELDLCSGPHLEKTSQVKAFKLLKVAGAYWRGEEKNQMLTRLYGTAFFSQKELEEFVWRREEAKKRDHRLLGKRLELFVISEEIGKGLPLFTPKGTTILRQIQEVEYELGREYGFQYVSTPHIATTALYQKTGHWQHYREVMYAPFGIEEEEYVLKPMNCPHHYMIYASRPRSYRELPLRLAENGTCYRFEKKGELSGLIRVRALTIDDAHILMREDQIEEEFAHCIQMIKKMFDILGLKDYYVRLSLPDPLDTIKYIADQKTWAKANKTLEKIVKDNKLTYKAVSGEASFYGPKIDYLVKDSLGREWQMSTLQLDLFMGKRLKLFYTDKDGSEKNPVILHRGLTGSLERTLAILIEHYAGNFPLWLAPVQVKLLPVSEKQVAFLSQVEKILFTQKIRVEADFRPEPLAAKIRDATLQKIPFLGIMGRKEEEKSREGKYFLSIRTREGKNLGEMEIGRFLDFLKQQIEKKI